MSAERDDPRAQTADTNVRSATNKEGTWHGRPYRKAHSLLWRLAYLGLCANEFVSASRADAIHMDASGHKAFAEALAKRVCELLK